MRTEAIKNIGWDDEVDDILRNHTFGTQLNDKEAEKLYPIFVKLVELIWHSEVHNGGVDESTKKDMFDTVLIRLLTYVLPRFDHKKYKGKIENYFVICGKREFFTLVGRHWRNQERVISGEIISAETGDGIERYDALQSKIAPAFITAGDREYEENITQKQLEEFEGMNDWAKRNLNEHRQKTMEIVRQYISGERTFIPTATTEYYHNRTNECYLYRGITKDLGLKSESNIQFFLRGVHKRYKKYKKKERR